MLGVRGHSLKLDAGGVHPAVGPLGIRVISMDLFLQEDHTPVVWMARRPRPSSGAAPWKCTPCASFSPTCTGAKLDILLLDLPPGTDRLATLNDLLPDLHGSVVVTIPSAVSQLIVSKSVTMARDLLRTPVIGLVET